ncbi:hypothetical protein TNCV_533971 [Trichonephila clavipes]|nr:hypothetical protein TNCV_533971 [Trichonephila clavipes]
MNVSHTNGVICISPSLARLALTGKWFVEPPLNHCSKRERQGGRTHELTICKKRPPVRTCLICALPSSDRRDFQPSRFYGPNQWLLELAFVTRSLREGEKKTSRATKPEAPVKNAIEVHPQHKVAGSPSYVSSVGSFIKPSFPWATSLFSPPCAQFKKVSQRPWRLTLPETSVAERRVDDSLGEGKWKVEELLKSTC